MHFSKGTGAGSRIIDSFKSGSVGKGNDKNVRGEWESRGIAAGVGEGAFGSGEVGIVAYRNDKMLLQLGVAQAKETAFSCIIFKLDEGSDEIG